MSMEYKSPIQSRASAEQKLKVKVAARNQRYGSPSLREQLREKCRIRIKNARQNLFANSRSMDTTSISSISLHEILREELAELDFNMELQDQIYNEMTDEINHWFVQQHVEEEDYMMTAVENPILICPVCLRSSVEVICSTDFYPLYNYRCECSASFIYNGNLELLRARLNTEIDSHEQNCLAQLHFFVNPLTQHLETICDDCDYFYTF